MSSICRCRLATTRCCHLLVLLSWPLLRKALSDFAQQTRNVRSKAVDDRKSFPIRPTGRNVENMQFTRCISRSGCAGGNWCRRELLHGRILRRCRAVDEGYCRRLEQCASAGAPPQAEAPWPRARSRCICSCSWGRISSVRGSGRYAGRRQGLGLVTSREGFGNGWKERPMT
jgi:hypothetical protein